MIRSRRLRPIISHVLGFTRATAHVRFFGAGFAGCIPGRRSYLIGATLCFGEAAQSAIPPIFWRKTVPILRPAYPFPFRIRALRSFPDGDARSMRAARFLRFSACPWETGRKTAIQTSANPLLPNDKRYSESFDGAVQNWGTHVVLCRRRERARIR